MIRKEHSNLSSKQHLIRVVLDTPLNQCFDYLFEAENTPNSENQLPSIPPIGSVVMVPFGKKEQAAIVVEHPEQSDVPNEKLRPITSFLSALPPLSTEWLTLCKFAARYYQRGLGEVALPALPKHLRQSKASIVDKYLKKSLPSSALPYQAKKELNAEQADVVAQLSAANHFQSFLLFGITGSGKTEVYLQATEQCLQRDPLAQVLILVPEINLTPQLLNHFQQRFPDQIIAIQNSGMSEAQRMHHWLAAHMGQANIVLGTRLAVLASMPHLKLIIVDEEHDISYKQQEGLRYSARDLAIYRAHQLNIPVVLGSATPSLESWYASQQKKYSLLKMENRAVKNASLPQIELVNINYHRTQHGLSDHVKLAIQATFEKGEQSLIFLNRRGYAPVLNCEACGWISPCLRCSANMVLHKGDNLLRCHHCGLELYIPKHCPTCGNQDLQALGRGTQRMEEHLEAIFPQARVFRIDADSTRLKGSAEKAFDKVHQGEVDILVGTQMVAKGHDFQKLSLVVIPSPDNALFAQDFRASERLFAQLMQVSGRAGRGGMESRVILQTRYPDHPLYQALVRHDYPFFANATLAERQQAMLPPFTFQALLKAEAKEMDLALSFLKAAKQVEIESDIVLHDPIPMAMAKVAHQHRAQLLLECNSRQKLQNFLENWMPVLKSIKTRAKWSVEIDPVDI